MTYAVTHTRKLKKDKQTITQPVVKGNEPSLTLRNRIIAKYSLNRYGIDSEHQCIVHPVKVIRCHILWAT